MNITGVILAAGTSSRMGSTNKLLLKYRNHTIIEATLQQLAHSGVDDLLIVTGFERSRIEIAVAAHLTNRISIVHNSNYHLGRAESIKCAVRHIKGKTDAVLFMVADKPGVTSELIDRAIDRYRQDQPAVLYVETPVGRGHPIIFSRALFDDLLLLNGDCVGDELVAKYRNDLVKIKDETPQIDIDNEDDYRALLIKETSQQR
ncbi:MAG: nucleotidyltransferase family protein [bacterium]